MLRVERLLFIVSLLSFTLVFVYLEIATKPNSLAAEVPPSLIEWRHVPPAPRGLRGLFQPPPPVDTGQWSARESLSIVVVGEGSRTEDTTTRTSGATTAAHEPRLTTDKETSHNATSTTSASSSVSSREDGAGKTGSHTTAAAVATRNSKNAAHDDRIVGRRSQNDATPSTDRQPTLITRSSWKSRATRSSAATTRLPVHTETHRQSSPGAAQRSLGDSSPSTSSPSSVAPSAGHSMQKESLKSESSSLKPVVVGRDMARLPPQTSLAQSRVSQTSSKRKSSKRPVVAQPARSDNSLTQSSAPPLPSRATLPHWFHPETRPYNKYRPRRLPKLTENFTWASELAHKCKEPNCRELLSFVEVSALQVCEKQTLAHVRGAALGKSTCRFIGGYRFPVALNSQEGSGNTWLRGLLEKTTGICTGFYGCDHEMRVRGFVGEEIKSGSVLVVKTHVHIPQWIGQRKKIPYESSYGSAVFLIRNPAGGMIAEWSRLYHLRDRRHSQHTHTNVIPESQFGTTEWFNFSVTYMEKWKVRTENWVLNNDDQKHKVHVVSYEDLQRDTLGEVEKILDFLHFPYNHDELAERLRDDFTTFRRPHSNDGFQHFSPEQKELLRKTITELNATAAAVAKANLFHFDEYLAALAALTTIN